MVDSIGRDEVLGFHAGEWIEILDDWQELHGLPGLLRRIRPGDGVDSATRSILLEDPLPAGLFPVDAQGRTTAERHTRIRRWDQSGLVRRADGTTFQDLNASASSDGILIPAAGVQLSLENGILVDFALAAGGEFKVGDYWVFAARVADGSIEQLTDAPPRGIHHHYARLAVVTFPDFETDCRVLWPPEVSGESCDCTVCVHAEAHNAGTATIQQAIDSIRTRGGTICLDAGLYRLRCAAQSGRGAIPQDPGAGLAHHPAAGRSDRRDLDSGRDRPLHREPVHHRGRSAQGWNGDDRRCQLRRPAADPSRRPRRAAGRDDLRCRRSRRGDPGRRHPGLRARRRGGHRGARRRRDYALTANLRITDNLLLCSETGLSLAGMCLHYGELALTGNLLLLCSQAGITATGAALPAASVTIAENVLQVTGDGIVAGSNGLRITDNEVVGAAARGKTATGITLAPGLDKGPINHAYITANRLSGLPGDGIAIKKGPGRGDDQVERRRWCRRRGADDDGGGERRLSHHREQSLHRSGTESERSGPALCRPAASRHEAGRCRGQSFRRGRGRRQSESPARGPARRQHRRARVAANRMFGIGPAEFLGRTIAIVIDASFRKLMLESNSIARIAEAGEKPSIAAWQAIVIAGFGVNTDAAGVSNSIQPFGAMMLPLKDNSFYLSGQQAILLDPARGVAAVRGNNLTGQSPNRPLVEISSLIGCRFDQNDAELTGNDGLIGIIAADHIGACQ